MQIFVRLNTESTAYCRWTSSPLYAANGSADYVGHKVVVSSGLAAAPDLVGRDDIEGGEEHQQHPGNGQSHGDLLGCGDTVGRYEE